MTHVLSNENNTLHRPQHTVFTHNEPVNCAIAKNTILIRDLDDIMRESVITKTIQRLNNQEVLEAIKAGCDALHVCSVTGCTYIHVVCLVCTPDSQTKLVPVVYQLSNLGVDINIQDKHNSTALTIAVQKRLPQLMTAILKCGAEIKDSDQYLAEDIRGVVKTEMLESLRRFHPTYWSAVHDLTANKVNRLVKAWTKINVSRNGQTLIEYAKHHAKDPSIVKLLLKHEASVELAHSVMAGDLERVKLLLRDGSADMNTCDTSVKENNLEPFAPLSLQAAATRYGHLHVLELLKQVANGNLKQLHHDSTNYNLSNFNLEEFSESGDINEGNSPLVKCDISNGSVFFKKSNHDHMRELQHHNTSVSSTLCEII